MFYCPSARPWSQNKLALVNNLLTDISDNGTMARDSFLKTAAPLVALTFYGVYQLTPATALMSEEEKAQVKQTEQSVYYSGCNEVRAAGKAPLFAGQPGYREGMDGDGDGIACEPYRGQY